MKVKKRNGEIVDFKKNKVFGAITRASESMNIKDKNLIRSITDKVITKLGDREEVNVEYIQDIVEETLMEEKQFLIARAYILWRQSRNNSRQVASSMGVVNDLKLPVSSLTVLAKRYLLRNVDGDIIETPKELYKRVSTAIAKIEEKQGTTSKEIKALTKEFYDFMASGTFLPNSPCLFSAGTEMSQLSACFTLNIDDSLESIFDVLKKSAKIFQTGGGVGYNFSNIRPKDDVVRSTKGVSSGPLSFMKVYNEMCEIIKQGCVSTSTLLRTENGIVPIGNFLKNDLVPKSVYTSNQNLDTAYLSNDNGVTDALSITTDLGLNIECTKNHHFKTVNENAEIVWKKAEELKEKDWLIAVKGGHVGKLQKLPKLTKQHFNANKVTVPEVMNEEFAELLGLYMSNGCMNNGRIIFTIHSDKEDLKEYIIKGMKNTFSLDLGYIGNKDELRGKYVDLWFFSKPLCDYLQTLGCTKEKSVNAFIPQVILSSPEKVACAFLRGYFEGDGSIREEGYPTLASTSENLVKTTQQLLLSLGIVSSIHIQANTKNEDHVIHTLTIIPENDVSTFIEKIGFISKEKQSRQVEQLHTKSFEQTDIIPNTQKLFNEICPKGKRHKYNHYLTQNTTHQRNLTRKRLTRIFNETPEIAQNEKLKTLMNENFYYTQITGIDNTKCYTVDIETSAGQYVANGLLVHNSFRRGAMMGILDVTHPNILDFIILKGKEGYLSNFNISVAVTDNFMKAVKTNKDIQLINPRTGKPIQSIPASAIWDLLVTEAWKTGDPGLVFIDTVNKSESNVVPKLGPIKSCNPCGEIFMYPSESCLASDTLIVTPDGITPIKTRVGNTEGYIYNNGFSKYNKIVSRGEKPIVKVVLSNGLSIKCTKDHKFRLKNGKDVEAQHLTSEDVMELNKEYPYNFIDDTDKKYEMYGWMHGDGWYNNSIGVSFNYKDGDKPVKEYLLPLFQHEFGCEGIKPSREDEVSYQIQTTRNHSLEHAHNLGFVKGLAIDKQLPTTFYDWNDIQQRSFIRGLFSADAGISGRTNSQIIFTSNSETLVEQVQQYLQCLGIKGHKRQTIFNSKLNRNPQYKLEVTCDSARAYMKYIGFVEGSPKTDKFVASLHHDREVTFKELIDEGKTEIVYDVVEVSNGNIFIANGIQVHNCNLGSLNLTKFTKEKEDCSGLEVDFDKLGKAVKLAIRFLDNVIDANKYPTQEISEMSLRLRRIGLGVMGWADTLILLKIPYDSQEALDLASKVMGFITKTATKASVELGERRGNFPEFEDSIWVKRGYKHMRNSAVTCIAPTGSISILAGCSQSIEPLMSVVTVRNLEETLGSNLVDVNPLFQQEAIRRGFWSEELMNKVSRTLSIQNMQEIPEDVRRIFVTAMDVKPEWHVRMQAAFQANTHNACSKTINLPHNATPHDVEEAFMLAWKLGAKGITVFRDGCLRKQVFTCVECEVPT